jgi:hypothetical protein
MPITGHSETWIRWSENATWILALIELPTATTLPLSEVRINTTQYPSFFSVGI